MKRRTALTALGFGLIGAVGVGMAAQAASSPTPRLPTECVSGVEAAYPPGAEPDPEGIGPVIVDSELSKFYYGDSVNVTDGISAQEMPIVQEVGSRIGFCLVRNDAEGDHWGAFLREPEQ